MSWLPIAAFVVLGLVFLDKALRRGAKRTWAWGRTGGGPKLSRRSYAVWALTFFTIAAILSRAHEPGGLAVLVIGVCLVAVIVAGFADAREQR